MSTRSGQGEGSLLLCSHQAVLLPGGEENQTETVNRFEIIGPRIPGIEQHGACLNQFVRDSVHQPLTEVLVLGFAVGVGIINAIVNWIELARLARTMRQIHDADAAPQTVFGTTVLAMPQFDEAGIPLVLNAIISQQERFGAVGNQTVYKFPQMSSCEPFALQKIGDGVVADLIQMFRQVRASVIGDGADQKFNVLKFGNRSHILSCGSLKQKS